MTTEEQTETIKRLELENQKLAAVLQQVCNHQQKLAEVIKNCEKHIAILQPALLRAYDRLNETDTALKELMTAPRDLTVVDAPVPQRVVGHFEIDRTRVARILCSVQLLTGKTDPDLFSGIYSPEEIEQAVKLVDEAWPTDDKKEDAQ